MIAGLLVSATLLAPRLSGQIFWDLNGATAGAGTTPTGIWDTTTANWNTRANGTTATETYISGEIASFSAGTDATGAYTVTVTGTQNVSRINIQEGTPTFTGGTINFNDATPDFNVSVGLTATVNSDLSGTDGLNKLGAGTLILGGSDKSYSGTTIINNGVLQLDFDQTFTTLDLSGGDLRLNAATTTITTLSVSANSIIDFSTAATLNITNFSISSGVTLTIQNWTDMSDFFFATNWAGAVVDTTGANPMSQVVFSGFAGSNTRWQGYDKQVTPVPEPSTTGALLLGALTGLFAWRRHRRAAAQ